MLAEYVVDTSSWEPWQRDYRFGMILVMLPQHVASSINALRQALDPKSHAICSAHISVSDPLHRELADVDREQIHGLLRAIEPFEVRYDGPTASTQRPGVTCPVSPQDRFDELKRVVHQASVFEGVAYHTRKIPAHVTIAEFVTVEESLKIARDLASTPLRGTFRCDRLEYVVPDATFRFHQCSTFVLGGHRRSSRRDALRDIDPTFRQGID
jgi:hypothetical protein